VPLTASRAYREVAIPIANGASQSPMINLENVIAGSYLTPAAFTNIGATNLGRWGVSNNYDDAVATALTTLLPDLTLAAAQTQRHSTSSRYGLPADVLKFRSARFDGVATEAADRVLLFTLLEGYVTWRRMDAVIANGGTQSETIQIAGARGGSVLIPSALTGTAVNFQFGDGGNWSDLKSTADLAPSQVVAVDRWIPIPDTVFNFPYMRVVSGSAEGAARILRVELKYVG
jgi:hypothetical protein